MSWEFQRLKARIERAYKLQRAKQIAERRRKRAKNFFGQPQPSGM